MNQQRVTNSKENVPYDIRVSQLGRWWTKQYCRFPVRRHIAELIRIITHSEIPNQRLFWFLKFNHLLSLPIWIHSTQALLNLQREINETASFTLVHTPSSSSIFRKHSRECGDIKFTNWESEATNSSFYKASSPIYYESKTKLSLPFQFKVAFLMFRYYQTYKFSCYTRPLHWWPYLLPILLPSQSSLNRPRNTSYYLYNIDI